MPGVIHRLSWIVLGRSTRRATAWQPSGARFHSIAGALLLLAFSTGETPVPGQMETRRTLDRGSRVYRQACAMCHGDSGSGNLPYGPTLAGASWLERCQPEHLPAIILDGVCGPIPGSPTPYPVMPALRTWLSDQQITDVSAYVFKRWSTRSAAPGLEVATSLRKRAPSRSTPWTLDELSKELPPPKIRTALWPF